MWLIAGLGNPGEQYANSLHNVGFWVLERLAAKLGESSWRDKYNGQMIKHGTGEDAVVLLKPQTYMNLSGESVAPCAHFFKIPPQNIVVVFDDMDLDLGKVRLRAKGSDGGHRGLQSVLQHVAEPSVLRVRVGVGRPPKNWDVKNYVLSNPTPEQKAVLDKCVDEVVKRLMTLIKKGTFETTSFQVSLES